MAYTRDIFPQWLQQSWYVGHQLWGRTADWGDPSFCDGLLDLLDDDIAACRGSLEPLAALGVAIVGDVASITDKGHLSGQAVEQLWFLRFYTSVHVVERAVASGRTFAAHDWLVTAIGVGPFIDSESGDTPEYTWDIGRLAVLANSAVPWISARASITVLSWCEHLLYYSRRHAALLEILMTNAEGEVEAPGSEHPFSGFDLLTGLLVARLISGASPAVFEAAVRALAQAIPWTQVYAPSAQESFVRMAIAAYSRPVATDMAKRTIGLCLSCCHHVLGRSGAAQWAKRVLSECGKKFVEHEEVQLLINSAATPEELDEKLVEVTCAIRRYLEALRQRTGISYPQLVYVQSRKYVVIWRLLEDLFHAGKCSDLVGVTGAWFGVPTSSMRCSPVICSYPNDGQGYVLAQEGRAFKRVRGQGEPLQKVVGLTNSILGTRISVVGQTAIPRFAGVEQCDRVRLADAWESALSEYYDIACWHGVADQLGAKNAILELTSLPYPLQAMLLHETGITWPLLTSMEEPERDREVRRALLWTCGVETGGDEMRHVKTCLEDQGVSVASHMGVDLTKRQFLDLYAAAEFDLIWLAAHGSFDAMRPHLASIQVATNGEQVTVSELVDVSRRWDGRRLLVANLCSSGSAQTTLAPPRLGFGPMLTSAKQAVVCNLWNVRELAAFAFGVLLGFGLVNTRGFFAAFAWALRKLRSDGSVIAGLLEGQARIRTSATEELTRLRHTSFTGDITVWGCPVFYE